MYFSGYIPQTQLKNTLGKKKFELLKLFEEYLSYPSSRDSTVECRM